MAVAVSRGAWRVDISCAKVRQLGNQESFALTLRKAWPDFNSLSRVNRCDISAPSRTSQYPAMPRRFFEERQQWASAEGSVDKTKNLIEKSVVQRRDSGRELCSRMRRTKKFAASREGTEGIRSDQAARFGERRFPSRRDRTERGGIVVRTGEPRATYPERGGKRNRPQPARTSVRSCVCADGSTSKEG